MAKLPARQPIPTQSKSIIEMQRGGSKTGLYKDTYDTTIYDELTISDSVRETRMFQVGQSGAKNLSQTNMKANGVIPQGRRFTVYGLKFSYVSNSLKSTAQLLDFFKLLNRTTLQFVLDGKADFGTWTASEIAGISIACPTSDATTSAFSNQLFEPTNRAFPLNIPIVLPAQQMFEVLCVHHTLPVTAFNGDLLKLGLVGIMENVN